MRPHGRRGRRGATGLRRENSSPSLSLTVKIKKKYQRAKGGKQQRIQCPLKGQEILMSFAEFFFFFLPTRNSIVIGHPWKSETMWGTRAKGEDEEGEEDRRVIKGSMLSGFMPWCHRKTSGGAFKNFFMIPSFHHFLMCPLPKL